MDYQILYQREIHKPSHLKARFALEEMFLPGLESTEKLTEEYRSI